MRHDVRSIARAASAAPAATFGKPPNRDLAAWSDDKFRVADHTGAIPPTQAAGVRRRGSSEKFQLFPERQHAKRRNQDGKKPNKVKETLVLSSPRSGVIIGSLDILVDIGVPAEKEVIQ